MGRDLQLFLVTFRLAVSAYDQTMHEGSYFTYIMASRSHTIYVGVTGDLLKRAFEHKWKEHEGFTARYNCDRLVWFERHRMCRRPLHAKRSSKAGGARKRLLSSNLRTRRGPTSAANGTTTNPRITGEPWIGWIVKNNRGSLVAALCRDDNALGGTAVSVSYGVVGVPSPTGKFPVLEYEKRPQTLPIAAFSVRMTARERESC